MDSRTRFGRILQSARARALPALAALAIFTSALAAQEGAFRLTQAIPDDVFVVTAERYNPERQFLYDYWDEVWVAFQESGVPDDFFDLVVTLAGEENRENLTRIRDRFGDLLRDVDWSAMGAGEVVFAERLTMRTLGTGQPVLVAPQDIVVLFRVTPEAARQNFAGLQAILEALTEEINQAAGLHMRVERSTRTDLELASLHLIQADPKMPDISIALGLHGDVIMFTFGGAIRDEVAGLLTGTSKHTSISDTPRFQAAFAALPQAEDGFEYVDMPNLRSSLERLFGGIVDMVEGEIAKTTPGDRILHANKDDAAIALHAESNQAYFAGNYEEALRLVEAAYEADPTDPTLMYNQACFLALLGEKERALPWLQKAVDSGFYAPRQIEADPDLASLRGDLRYKTALEVARHGARAERHGYLVAARSVLGRLLGSLGAIDYVAAVRHTEGYDVYRDTIAALAADASSNPIYPVLTAGRPVADFARYLPVETVSFTTTGGTDLDALYSFVEESVAETGDFGERLLQTWKGFQARHEFDFRKDVIGWIDGESMSVSFDDEGTDSWVWMLRVKDDDEARKKLAFCLDFLPRKMTELISKAPMLAMLSMRSSPSAHEELPGFHEVRFALAPVPIVCGVRDGWLVMGSSGNAVVLTQKTAAGEHPSVRDNEALMALALLPETPATSIHFRDHRGDVETIVAILDGVAAASGMMSAMIPDPQAQQAVMTLGDMVRKLSPVAEKMDFFDSSAGYQTFDGRAWRGRSVTHYVPPSG